ncbi:Collagen alpha-1(VII) chain, partial [Ophiophagus hannah]
DQEEGRRGGNVSKAPLETRQKSRNCSDNSPPTLWGRVLSFPKDWGWGEVNRGGNLGEGKPPSPPVPLLKVSRRGREGREGTSAQHSWAGMPHLVGQNGGSQALLPQKGVESPPPCQASWGREQQAGKITVSFPPPLTQNNNFGRRQGPPFKRGRKEGGKEGRKEKRWEGRRKEGRKKKAT